MVSREQIDEVVEKTDIVDLVSQYVTLEKSGAGFRGLCPFHNENTPSFMVSPSKKIAKCMGCGGGGNPITFLRQIKNIDFNEALEELATKAGVKLEGFTSYKKVDNFSHFYEIMETSKKFYMHNLFNTKFGLEAIEYLHKRGINDETIKKFEIGVSLNSIDSLYQVLKAEGYNEVDMTTLGLVKSNKDSFYDLFRGRIMFPIKNENGKTIAYSARIFNNDDKNQPKYVNSPESPIFYKHLTLYHLSDAIPEVRKLHRIILHEGQMDVIKSVSSGFGEAVCSMGTALTKDQVSIMKKYAKKVIVVYDGDKAGIEAMMKAIHLMKNEDVELKLVILPDKEDPDSFVQKYGADKFRQYVETKQLDPLDFILEYSIKDKDFNKISDVEQAKKVLFENLRTVSSRVAIERYIGILADKMNVSKASLLMDFNDYYTPSPSEKIDEFLSTRTENFQVIENSKYMTNTAWAELRLLNYAKFSKDKAIMIEESFPNQDIRPYLEKIHQELWDELTCGYYIQYKQFVENVFLQSLNEKLHSCYLQNIKSLYNNGDYLINYSDQDLKQCIDMLITHNMVKRIDEINEKIKTANQADKLKLLNEKVKLLQKYNLSLKQKKESRY